MSGMNSAVRSAGLLVLGLNVPSCSQSVAWQGCGAGGGVGARRAREACAPVSPGPGSLRVRRPRRDRRCCALRDAPMPFPGARQRARLSSDPPIPFLDSEAAPWMSRGTTAPSGTAGDGTELHPRLRSGRRPAGRRTPTRGRCVVYRCAPTRDRRRRPVLRALPQNTRIGDTLKVQVAPRHLDTVGLRVPGRDPNDCISTG